MTDHTLIGGRERRRVEIVDYNSGWPTVFQNHASRIGHALGEYAAISIAYTVASCFDVIEREGRFDLVERQIDPPYRKDYDAIAGNHPLDWQHRFDMRGWGILLALDDNQHVGGAIIAGRTGGIELLGEQHDLAVLWDIRVAPQCRLAGVGRALFEAAEQWARLQGYRELLVETQNVNVPACRFYQRHECTLVTANHDVYVEFPEEIQLLWSKSLC